MTSRSTSISAQPSHRPSLPDRRNSRRFSTISGSELGRNGAAAGEHELTEEIEEIKRYEDFTTIDWVQDAAREQLRRRARRQENAGFFARDGRLGWRQTLRDSYEAGQAWIVVTLVGAIIGLNAGFLNIITEWLSDIKLGYCTTAFYLNEGFCCWGVDKGGHDSSLSEGCSWQQAAMNGIDGAQFGPSTTSSTLFSRYVWSRHLLDWELRVYRRSLL